MSEAKYFVTNGDNITGLLWENEKLGRMFVLMNNIDPNFDLEIRDCETNQTVKNVDMRDFLLEILPQEESKE